jgi:hypothetical protein
MQRFRKSFFEDLCNKGLTTHQAGPAARRTAHWALVDLSRLNGDLSKYHRRQIVISLNQAAGHRRWMKELLSAAADSRANQQPFMPMRCSGGMVNSTQERARLVAADARAALNRARFHREQLAALTQ